MPPRRMLRKDVIGRVTKSLSPSQRSLRHDDSPSPSRKQSHTKDNAGETSSKRARTWKDKLISFGYKDLEGVNTLHNDAIVINVTIHNYLVRRVLFNTGGGTDIL